MPNRKTRPTSPGRRFGTYQVRDEVTNAEPSKKLTKGKGSSGGRNSNGRVTARHRGGGAKRRYRQIDFKRTKDGIPAQRCLDRVRPEPLGEHRPDQLRRRREALHPRPQGLRVGAEVVSGEGADITPGNSLTLARIPTGTVVHNVELVPGQGGKLGRAAARRSRWSPRRARW